MESSNTRFLGWTAPSRQTTPGYCSPSQRDRRARACPGTCVTHGALFCASLGLSQTAGIVVGTLLINGFFTKNLAHYLRLDQVSDAKLIRYRSAIRILKESLQVWLWAGVWG